MPGLCNPVLVTHDLTQSFRAHTFSLREDPWPNFSFRVAYAHRIFDDAAQCKFCFRIASASACLEHSSATASASFCYAGFSLRKRNSRTSPLCNFIMEVFDAAQMCQAPECFCCPPKVYHHCPYNGVRLATKEWLGLVEWCWKNITANQKSMEIRMHVCFSPNAWGWPSKSRSRSASTPYYFLQGVTNDFILASSFLA